MPCASPARTVPNRTASTSSSWASVVSSGPSKKSAAGDLAAPGGPDRLDDTAGEDERPTASRPRGRRGRSSPRWCPGCGSPGGRRCAAPGGAGAGRHGRPSCALEPGVPDERADADPLVGDVDGIQPGDAVDVDEVAGVGQAHVEHRDQALPAGEHLAVVADLAEHGDGLVDGAGCVVHERSGLHLVDPACSRGPGERNRPTRRCWPRAGRRRRCAAVAGVSRPVGQGRRSRSGSRSPPVPG